MRLVISAWCLVNCYPVVTELFIRDRKLNISIVFITQSYLTVSRNTRLNSTHYLVIKISNKN